MRSRAKRGFVMITMTVSIVAILAVLGLAIDTGYLQLVKIRMQTAADAAALGGVAQRKTAGAGGVTTAAKADSAANGFADGMKNVVVTVNNPPSTGFYVGDSSAVEVRIQQTVAPFFMALAGFRSMPVRARAVARLGPGSSCIFVLDPHSSQAMKASGGAQISVACGIMVNSDSETAVKVSGGARIAGASVSIVGNYSESGGAHVVPTPSIHVSAEPDPLAYLTPPAVVGCDKTGYHLSGGKTDTIDPGVYCGGIQVSGGARLTLNGGTYKLKGGGFKISGGATINGTGVVFYNTYAPGYAYDGISFSGGCNVTLSAPTTGDFAGILFFQDRTYNGNSASTFSGGTSTRLDGALYFPTTELSYSGGAGSNYTILVAYTVSFSGGTNVNSNYTSLPGGTPVKGYGTLSE